jgi:NADH-quinone oxidoreductase subunit E
MFTLILKSAILCLICFFLFAKLGQWLGRKKASESPKSGALTPKSKPIASVQLMTVVPGSLTPVTSHSPEEVSVDLSQLNSDELEALIANAKSEEPETLKKPKGMADDLKLINGIGPVNEKELNSLGIYHFWQIAAWTPGHIAWVSSRIRFAGRITRENWMRQAKDMIKPL